MNQITEFTDYVLSFYGKDGIYDFNATRIEVLEALAIRILTSIPNENGVPLNTIPFEGDSFDREYVRDIILKQRGTNEQRLSSHSIGNHCNRRFL